MTKAFDKPVHKYCRLELGETSVYAYYAGFFFAFRQKADATNEYTKFTSVAEFIGPLRELKPA
jgi:hypothetical protein